MTAGRLDDAAAVILALLASAAVRAMVVAILAGVALAVMRARRASVHLAGWTLVLGAAVAMPVLGWMLPAVRWSLPIVLPAAAPAPAIAVTAHSVTIGGPEGPPRDRRQHDASVTLATSPTSQNLAPPVTTPTQSPASRSAAPSWPVIAFLVYLCGVVVLLVRAGAGWMVARRLRRTTPLIEDAGVLARLRAVSANAGLAASPALAEADSLVVPITMSVRQPAILLPTTWRTWDAATLDAVLAHEVAHVARRDTLTQHLSLIYRAVFWFSPLGWWLRRTLANLAEHASDEAVLDAGTDRTAYAETVLSFFAALQTDRRRAHWPAIAMARGSGASRRVERILAWSGAGRTRLARPLVAALMFGAGLVIVLAATIRPVVTSGLAVPAEIPTAFQKPTEAPRGNWQSPMTAAGRVPARTAPPQSAAPASDSRTVRIDTVMNYVVVRNPLGRAVTGLTADDFRVFEDGVEQKIDVFTPYVASRIVGGGTRVVAAPAQTVSGRAFVIFIDDLNIAPADAAGLTRTLEAIRDYLHDDDLVSIVSTGYSSIEVDLTYDRGHARFNAAMAKIATRPGTPPVVAQSEDGRRYMAHTALKTAYDVVQRVGQMNTDRRKTLIYISGGYDHDPVWTASSSSPRVDSTLRHNAGFQAAPALPEDPFAKTGSQFTNADLVADLAAIIRAANRAALTFYAVNTRAIRTGPNGMTAEEWQSYFAGTNSLLTLANNTGGFLIEAANAAQGLERIDNETTSTDQSHYLIGYTTSNHDLSQKTRKVEIRVARPDVQLLYRQTYTIK